MKKLKSSSANAIFTETMRNIVGQMFLQTIEEWSQIISLYQKVITVQVLSSTQEKLETAAKTLKKTTNEIHGDKSLHNRS